MREFSSAARFADIIVVSKTPTDCDEKQREAVLTALSPKVHQQVFFTTYEYQPLQPLNEKAQQTDYNDATTVLAVTGIANPEPLYQELRSRFVNMVPLRFPDHYNFTAADMKRVVNTYQQYKQNCIVVTTEKDYMRLKSGELENILSLLPIFVQPIQVKVLFNQENQFNKTILSYVTKD